MTEFWLDRGTASTQPAMHLTGSHSAIESAISHLSYATLALAPMSLSANDRQRVRVLMEQLMEKIGTD